MWCTELLLQPRQLIALLAVERTRPLLHACPAGCALLCPSQRTRRHVPPPPTLCQALKLAKKAAKRKQIKRGVKEVIKAIRKKAKG